MLLHKNLSIVRKRFYHQRVCSSSPDKGVTYLDAKMLKDIVNRGIHPIRCASTCARKAQKGLLLGDLCAEAHHPMWALKIWFFVLDQIHNKDYDDWLYEWFNDKYVRLQDVISDGICEIIGRRIDEVERRLGLADAQGRDSWEYRAGDGWYDYFRYEKFDYYWDDWRDYYLELRNEAMSRQKTERLFRQGQGELPPQGQDFFDYWNDCDPMTQEDYYFNIDDWD